MLKEHGIGYAEHIDNFSNWIKSLSIPSRIISRIANSIGEKMNIVFPNMLQSSESMFYPPPQAICDGEEVHLAEAVNDSRITGFLSEPVTGELTEVSV